MPRPPRAPRPVVDAPGDPHDLTAAVAAALDGGPVVAGGPDAVRAGQAAAARRGLPGDTALLIRTSGSTGAPRTVTLGAGALRAGAAATHARLGGPGRWLLALPASHVAGLQVVVRSVVAGTTPVAAPAGAAFTPGLLADLLDDLGAGTPPDGAGSGGRRYASLVPTQLHRVVEAAASAGPGGTDGRRALAGLRTVDAVLLGGAAPPAPLVRRAREAGVRVVTTYGMTETCGGCVYDGVPLDGVEVRTGAGGVLEIAGPVLAAGYLEPDATGSSSFHADPATGRRWFRTSDLGTVEPAGATTRVTVLGRADDVLITGGVNVAPAAVEAALAGLDEIGEVCVVGVPHPEWGTSIVAVVTRSAPSTAAPPAVTAEMASSAPNSSNSGAELAISADGGAALLERVRARVTDTLGAPGAPRRVVVVDELPSRGPGKVDRAACAALARAALARATPAAERDENRA
ncbi:AMP-binding protein [Cellulomonas sp. PhB143]|uniref:AMP-binding protein n=1 Tax=Cellulomonas sp. PhB143 TaxID=2485186 RepID=UPI000FAE66EA|nr:AMP-binding protein [Cellulomonas sp. PhB143]ROS76695.1 O-succinylbenzoic acid--CoA ligase [Cellulomonas sp. PhB143]